MSDDKRLERMEVKLDDISDHLGSIDTTLGAQRITLDEHIRRTAIIERELLPIKKHVNMMQGAGALIAMIALIATIVGLFYK